MIASFAWNYKRKIRTTKERAKVVALEVGTGVCGWESMEEAEGCATRPLREISPSWSRLRRAGAQRWLSPATKRARAACYVLPPNVTGMKLPRQGRKGEKAEPTREVLTGVHTYRV
ncbi:hypothetical protein MRX96_011408 [Rhipicephalus microplus]